MRPERPSCRELPCSPNFILVKVSLLNRVYNLELVIYWIYYYHLAMPLGQSSYYMPEKAKAAERSQARPGARSWHWHLQLRLCLLAA
jgi:hypothetical protein